MKQIPLRSAKYPGLFALVDDEDYEWLSQYKWCPHAYKTVMYAVTKIKDSEGKWRHVKMHRLILDAPTEMEVDHENRNGLDNQRHNIRLATKSQNMRNIAGRIGSSSFVGVSFHKNRKKWVAYATDDGGRRVNLGTFISEKDAAVARDTYVKSAYGPFVVLNFPNGQPV